MVTVSSLWHSAHFGICACGPTVLGVWPNFPIVSKLLLVSLHTGLDEILPVWTARPMWCWTARPTWRGSTSCSCSLMPWPSPPSEWGRGELSSHFILTVLTYVLGMLRATGSRGNRFFNLTKRIHFIPTWVGNEVSYQVALFWLFWHI